MSLAQPSACGVLLAGLRGASFFFFLFHFFPAPLLAISPCVRPLATRRSFLFFFFLSSSRRPATARAATGPSPPTRPRKGKPPPQRLEGSRRSEGLVCARAPEGPVGETASTSSGHLKRARTHRCCDQLPSALPMSARVSDMSAHARRATGGSAVGRRLQFLSIDLNGRCVQHLGIITRRSSREVLNLSKTRRSFAKSGFPFPPRRRRRPATQGARKRAPPRQGP